MKVRIFYSMAYKILKIPKKENLKKIKTEKKELLLCEVHLQILQRQQREPSLPPPPSLSLSHCQIYFNLNDFVFVFALAFSLYLFAASSSSSDFAFSAREQRGAGEGPMDSRTQYNPRTVEEVFRDFKGRRAGLIKALTTGICCCNHSFFFLFHFQKKIEISITLFNAVFLVKKCALSAKFSIFDFFSSVFT